MIFHMGSLRRKSIWRFSQDMKLLPILFIVDLKESECIVNELNCPTPRKAFSYLNKNVTNFLKETGKEACTPICTPMDSNLKLGNAKDNVSMDNEMLDISFFSNLCITKSSPLIDHSLKFAIP
ncbi:hypothetical protein CR513_25754, partial [Mucuna pruriens]